MTSSRPGIVRVELVMGMPVSIDVRDADVGPEAVESAFAWLRQVDATFSTYNPGSELSRTNRGELAVADAHPDLAEVLARCEQLRELTDGWFDIATTARCSRRSASRSRRRAKPGSTRLKLAASLPTHRA